METCMECLHNACALLCSCHSSNLRVPRLAKPPPHTHTRIRATPSPAHPAPPASPRLSKRCGSRKCSSMKSSLRSFCSGVPAGGRQREAQGKQQNRQQQQQQWRSSGGGGGTSLASRPQCGEQASSDHHAADRPVPGGKPRGSPAAARCLARDAAPRRHPRRLTRQQHAVAAAQALQRLEQPRLQVAGRCAEHAQTTARLWPHGLVETRRKAAAAATRRGSPHLPLFSSRPSHALSHPPRPSLPFICCPSSTTSPSCTSCPPACCPSNPFHHPHHPHSPPPCSSGGAPHPPPAPPTPASPPPPPRQPASRRR